ncbi:hypothetical protein [uncultured Pseudokineococcus sp.]|uniref:hypothetical protein n=1 Tax=uncultured Pseudokineococcus sp. TaxID=1642928 RepID=UPI0026382BEF|nr:hypothetical protein [uncultured Pseudokineococcus sp.]
MTRTAALAAAAVLALAGCGSAADSAPAPAPAQTTRSTAAAEGDWNAACTRFAEYVQAGQPGEGVPRDERFTAVQDVSGLLGDHPDDALQSGRDGLVSALNTTDEEWVAAADTFAQACFDAGWDG